MAIDHIIPKPLGLLAVLGALCLSGACVSHPAFAGGSSEHHSHEWDRDDEDDDTIDTRVAAGRRLDWKTPDFHAREKESLLHIQLLGINDFHGQLSAGRRVANRGPLRRLGSCLIGLQPFRGVLEPVIREIEIGLRQPDQESGRRHAFPHPDQQSLQVAFERLRIAGRHLVALSMSMTDDHENGDEEEGRQKRRVPKTALPRHSCRPRHVHFA
jgi:hypothetical protein